MARKFKIPKYVEFPVISMFPHGTTGWRMEFTYRADGKDHVFRTCRNVMAIYKRMQNKYRYSPDWIERLRLRAMQGDFVLRFSPNDRDMYTVKLVDKKNGKIFTLIGDRYGSSGYGYTETKDHIQKAFFKGRGY
jgi:hypothetical protein